MKNTIAGSKNILKMVPLHPLFMTNQLSGLGRVLPPYGAEGARLWTPEYNKAYEEAFNGESLVLNYPALWYDIGEDTDEARNKLQYVRTTSCSQEIILDRLRTGVTTMEST